MTRNLLFLIGMLGLLPVSCLAAEKKASASPSMVREQVEKPATKKWISWLKRASTQQRAQWVCFFVASCLYTAQFEKTPLYGSLSEDLRLDVVGPFLYRTGFETFLFHFLLNLALAWAVGEKKESKKLIRKGGVWHKSLSFSWIAWLPLLYCTARKFNPHSSKFPKRKYEPIIASPMLYFFLSKLELETFEWIGGFALCLIEGYIFSLICQIAMWGYGKATAVWGKSEQLMGKVPAAPIISCL